MAQQRGLFQLPDDSDSDKNPLSRSIVGEPTVPETTPFESFNFKHLWRKTPTPDPWMTDTEESFQTTPELSASTKWFFEALQERRNPETPIAQKPTKMLEDNNDKRTSEIKGGRITPFSGKRETLE